MNERDEDRILNERRTMKDKIARLTRENEAMRMALEETRADLDLYGLDDFSTTTDEAIARIDAALSLKEPTDAQA